MTSGGEAAATLQSQEENPRVLIAGIGNIFLGDDGFGVEVVKRLQSVTLPHWVRVADFGIRGVHLAYEILDTAYERIILVDAAARGGEPGTLYVIEHNLDDKTNNRASSPDAHGMNPEAVFSLIKQLGVTPSHVLIVGCEPSATQEEIGLSEPVAAAIDEAVNLLLKLVQSQGPNSSANKDHLASTSKVRRRL